VLNVASGTASKSEFSHQAIHATSSILEKAMHQLCFSFKQIAQNIDNTELNT
jgi:hypothetical protein